LSKQTFWLSFIKIGLQMWPLEWKEKFPKIWPGDLVFDPTWPIFELLLDILLKQTFWPSSIKIGLQMWHLEFKQEFPKIWAGDLVFDPTWPVFERGLDIINIMLPREKSICHTGVGAFQGYFKPKKWQGKFKKSMLIFCIMTYNTN